MQNFKTGDGITCSIHANPVAIANMSSVCSSACQHCDLSNVANQERVHCLGPILLCDSRQICKHVTQESGTKSIR